MENFKFCALNFPQQYDVCAHFRELAEVEVKGAYVHDRQAFEKYVQRSLEKLGNDAFLHLVLGDKIIGQMELGVKNTSGYVHLLYILPEYRGKGYFAIMHEKMLAIFKHAHIYKIMLSTPATNKRAIAIYRHYGWEQLSHAPDQKGLLQFEFNVSK